MLRVDSNRLVIYFVWGMLGAKLENIFKKNSVDECECVHVEERKGKGRKRKGRILDASRIGAK